MAKHIVTITPPTPNGDLHLGHVSGPFLAADVCTRVLRQSGHDVLLLCYSDDYQSYLLRKARELDRDRRQIAGENAAAIARSLAALNIDLDHFLRAFDNPAFLESVEHYFELLAARGEIQMRSLLMPHCLQCGIEGYEGFGRGRCNFCGSPSDASQCEACARVPVLSEMGPLSCVLCKQPMSQRVKSLWAWPIGKHYAGLRQKYARRNHRAALKEYLAETLGEPADEWVLTRAGEEAIPLRRFPDQPVHTWFAGLAGYRATLRELLERRGENSFAQWWSPDTRLVQFLGFDCTYSHAVAYASLLQLDERGPQDVFHFTNRFLKLDGEDFSTSRNHAIWAKDIVARYCVDAVRFYVALKSPENEVQNFVQADFDRWYRTTFAAIEHGSWLESTSATAAKLSSSTETALAPLIAKWKTGRDLDTFSVAALAQVQQGLFEVIQGAPLAEHQALWSVFGELGEALLPELSRTIRNSLRQHQPSDLQRWASAHIEWA